MQDVYTIAKLARLLHRTPKEISRDVDQGLLEGRKIRGEWEFTLNAVGAYIGQCVVEGISDEDLRYLLTHTTQSSEPQSIASLLYPETILVPFSAKTRASVFREIMAPGINSGRIWDVNRMEAAIQRREEMASTAMENGVALLHPRTPIPSAISETFLTIGIAPRGIPFGGGFGNMTDVFFLLCCMDDQVHVRVLAKLGRLFQQPNFLDTLREQTDPEGVIDCIIAAEATLK